MAARPADKAKQALTGDLVAAASSRTGSEYVIELPGEGINNIAPTAFAGYEKVRALDLSFNHLTRVDGIETLTGLRELKVANNELEVISGLDRAKGLEKLLVQNNVIAKVSGILELKFLKQLRLDGNKLSAIEGLEKCFSLTELDLSRNAISSSKGLKPVAKLTTLNLAHNRLTSMGPELCSLSALTELDVSHNAIGTVPSTAAKEQQPTPGAKGRTGPVVATALSPLSGLTNLTSLRSLDLSFNHLSSWDGFGPLPQLAELYLSSNKLGPNLPAAFATWFPALEVLKLDNNQLAVSGGPVSVSKLLAVLEPIRGLTFLSEIDLRGNPCCEGLQHDDVVMAVKKVLTSGSSGRADRAVGPASLLEVVNGQELELDDSLPGAGSGGPQGAGALAAVDEEDNADVSTGSAGAAAGAGGQRPGAATGSRGANGRPGTAGGRPGTASGRPAGPPLMRPPTASGARPGTASSGGRPGTGSAAGLSSTGAAGTGPLPMARPMSAAAKALAQETIRYKAANSSTSSGSSSLATGAGAAGLPGDAMADLLAVGAQRQEMLAVRDSAKESLARLKQQMHERIAIASGQAPSTGAASGAAGGASKPDAKTNRYLAAAAARRAAAAAADAAIAMAETAGAAASTEDKPTAGASATAVGQATPSVSAAGPSASGPTVGPGGAIGSIASTVAAQAAAVKAPARRSAAVTVTTSTAPALSLPSGLSASSAVGQTEAGPGIGGPSSVPSSPGRASDENDSEGMLGGARPAAAGVDVHPVLAKGAASGANFGLMPSVGSVAPAQAVGFRLNLGKVRSGPVVATAQALGGSGKAADGSQGLISGKGAAAASGPAAVSSAVVAAPGAAPVARPGSASGRRVGEVLQPAGAASGQGWSGTAVNTGPGAAKAAGLARPGSAGLSSGVSGLKGSGAARALSEDQLSSVLGAIK